jgi:hypothetical protein
MRGRTVSHNHFSLLDHVDRRELCSQDRVEARGDRIMKGTLPTGKNLEWLTLVERLDAPRLGLYYSTSLTISDGPVNPREG